MKLGEYIVILPPMINQLKLSGNNLIIFALIHGFTKDGLHKFYGSIDTICEWTNLSRPTVISILKNLTDNGLLNKEEQVINNIKTCLYTTNYNELIGGGKETLLPVKKLNWGSKETLPNNNYSITNNIYKEKDIEIDKSISIKKKKNSFNVRQDLSYVDEAFRDIWLEWLDYKDEINKQYKTQRGAISQYNTLKKYANDKPHLANAIVKRSIEQSWDGLFPLTEKQVTLFSSQNSPYAIDKIENNIEPTENEPTKLVINGQIYR